ncbi:Abi family protein [Bacillus sp. 1A]|uniref:Abi family protein n=1 Tax=Bacillus sp. 1A TaxID=3461399 RepID=UPI0040448BF8
MCSIKLEDLQRLKKFKETNKEELQQNELIPYKELPEYDLIKKAKNKEKMKIDEQIDYLRFKGVTFNYINESDAKNYLIENSYYYKLTAYRKNFPKNKQQKYQNLDFANLTDLAVIDMHLRYLLIKLSLDIEHSIKTKLMNLITNSDEDGYTIIEEYNNYQLNNIADKENFVHVSQKILKDSENKKGYHRDLYEKYQKNPNIWVLIELMSYGQLSNFIRFYVEKEKFGRNDLKNASDVMHFSKNIRDSAAHSRPILLNIVEPGQFKGRNNPKPKLRQYISNVGLPKPFVKPYMTNIKVHDLCALLYLHDNYVKGPRTRKERKKEMKSVFRRAKREKHLYTESKELGEVLLLFGHLITRYSC